MRVLIISPHFPPSNAADMQRVRLILPYLKEQGVHAEVLVVDSADVACPLDAWMAAGLPEDIPVHRVRAMGLQWGKIPGFGTLGFRALRALRRKGDELLGGGQGTEDGRRRTEEGSGNGLDGAQLSQTEDGAQQERCPQVLSPPSAFRPPSSVLRSPSSFDLIYFSTTVFPVHVLGPRWKKKFGVPFVMDYQDPWVSDYYREHPDVVPPGGRLKYAVASWLNRRQEPRVLRHCSGITSVSAAYPEQLEKRYPWLKVEEQGTGDGGQETKILPLSFKNQKSTIVNRQSLLLPSLLLPFPGDARDFERVKSEDVRQSVFDPKDGLKHWVYVGVCPPSMLLAVRSLFCALAELGPPSSGFRLHFIGTSYAAAGTGVKIVEPLAKEYGLEATVYESTDRIPYSETLRCLLDADALIVPGSDDPGYTASKIYPYLLAGKPLLAVFHEQSSVVDLIRKVGGGTVIPFSSGEVAESIAAKISSEWLSNGGPEHVVPLDQDAFAPHSARAQAKMLAGFWSKCIEP